MKTKLLLLFFGVTIISNAQKLNFTYDASGNQILRVLCLSNCGSSNKSSLNETKEISALTDDDLIKFSREDKFSYYPNPVKEELFVQWTDAEDESSVSNIQVFSINGQVLRTYNSPATNNQIIFFRDYPSGVYMVVIHYQNGQQETIKIIKQ